MLNSQIPQEFWKQLQFDSKSCPPLDRAIYDPDFFEIESFSLARLDESDDDRYSQFGRLPQGRS